MRGMMVFHCGGMIGGPDTPVDDPRKVSREHDNMDELGRCRIVVADTHKKVSAPLRPDGTVAPCWGCPCAETAGRTQDKGFPPGHKKGRVVTPNEWHRWVCCYGRFIPIATRGQVTEAVRAELEERGKR